MDKIEITGIDLIKFVKKVYDLSVPQGMGFLHCTSEGLTDEEAQTIINAGIQMDYIKGRSCKMNVYHEGNKLFIRPMWYDHTDEDLNKLLAYINIKTVISNNKHSYSCNCSNCQIKRGYSA